MTEGNGKSVTPPEIIVPPSAKEPVIMCHKFFAPVIIQQPDPLVKNKINLTPQIGNFPCIKKNCMMWNEAEQECYDVTAAKGQSRAGEYAFAKLNDVHIPGGGGV